MIFLYIISGIIAFFVIALSIRFKIHFEYDNTVTCYAKWLFIKIPIFPGKEKINEEKSEDTTNEKADLPLNEDTEEKAEYCFDDEKAEEIKNEPVIAEEINDGIEVKTEISSDNSVAENEVNENENTCEASEKDDSFINDSDIKTEEPLNKTEESTAEKTEKQTTADEKGYKQDDKPKANSITDIKGIITTFYDNTGIDGVIELLNRLFTALNNYSRRMIHWFVCDEIYINAVIAGDDAAKTAESYGKYCSIIFPLFGNLISRFNVKKYDIDISPDFLASEGNATVILTMSIIPRKIINSTVILGFDLVVKFLLKLLKHGRVPENINNNSENK